VYATFGCTRGLDEHRSYELRMTLQHSLTVLDIRPELLYGHAAVRSDKI
jgi:hypothetical protein